MCPSIQPAIEDKLPYAFEFPEPEVNEAYLRASYEPGHVVVGFKKGGLVVHAGGRAVLVDQLGVEDINDPKATVAEMLVADNGRTATIRCVGPESAGLAEQIVQLDRPSTLTIDRACSQPLSWWHAGDALQGGNTVRWPDGTTLSIERGAIAATDPTGYTDSKEHYAGMKYADPKPVVYPTTTVEPVDGRITIRITTP